MRFFKILSEDDIKICSKSIKQHNFEDGIQTQPEEGMKRNTEATNIPDDVRKIVTNRLYDTYYMDSVYCPTRVSVNFYNQYKKDDYYNLHIDEFKAQPKSNNVFFDYGFSINLKDDYEGGEFILQTPVGRIAKKLKAGEMAIFPIIYPHGVDKITEGVRKNIVGWISSNISYEQSYILHNLFEITTYVGSTKDKNMFTKANLIQNYLKKEWSN